MALPSTRAVTLFEDEVSEEVNEPPVPNVRFTIMFDRIKYFRNKSLLCRVFVGCSLSGTLTTTVNVSSGEPLASLAD
jgi:hypothetical protein